MEYDTAQDAFRKQPSDATAQVYNRVAWHAYFNGRISDRQMQEAQKELEAFWWRNIEVV